MNSIKLIIKKGYVMILLIMIALFVSCSEEDTDTQKPVIDLTEGSPQPCDTLQRGDVFEFKAQFLDNVALGSYNLELHHNFDHHTHGSHAATCPQEEDKEAINPFYFNESFTISGNPASFEAEQAIPIPADIDPGDYHFMVKLIDAEGWQSWQSVSLKII